jgi:hypothetical protein
MKRNDLSDIEIEIEKIEAEQKVLDLRVLAVRNSLVKIKEDKNK